MIKSETFKVRFGKPENGWIEIHIKNSGNTFFLQISYTPFHLVEELINAIIKVLDGESVKANGSYNPERYEFIFDVKDEMVHLYVLEFHDYKINENFRKILFDITGERLKICKSFWRGFKDLQGKISSEEYKELFHREFPTRDLEFLSYKISQLEM